MTSRISLPPATRRRWALLCLLALLLRLALPVTVHASPGGELALCTGARLQPAPAGTVQPAGDFCSLCLSGLCSPAGGLTPPAAALPLLAEARHPAPARWRPAGLERPHRRQLPPARAPPSHS